MSMPFFKTQVEAQNFWDSVAADSPGEGFDEVVRVYVPKGRGFLQTRNASGYYWISKVYAKQLGLTLHKK